MPKRMLIDASHPEETRVVVLDGQRVEEFDFEAASKRPLKGNIYLAKVTRVEPSLQAAFVEYGGNRQGFLAFSEIHPDYYQIPVADRMAILAEQEADARQRQEDDIESFEITSSKRKRKKGEPEEQAPAPVIGDEAPDSALSGSGGDEDENVTDVEFVPEGHEDEGDDGEDTGEQETDGYERDSDAEPDSAGPQNGEAAAQESDITAENGEPAPAAETEGQREPAQPLESKRPSQRWMKRRHYKIQEVIKRRQIILVQVVKEERGNKGAALTTYLSLAGRYCVLMPNTPRGGGISRKITNAVDRKRLKSAAQALELPEGMGLIIRTAGENRTKVEIKRDYEYLLRLWDTIRELTLKSNAPACVYEEGDLIKRAIRDLYNKDVTEVTVEGEDGYRNAKDFMRMLMPSHAKNVHPYKEPVPLFQRHHIEAQLDAMFSPTVTLKSGGYIVINQTEALVSIDVNSGRATREHSIEETATKTNLEAADEVGRQLRLRDLAGLIVIDFIDMEDARNDRSVEKRLHNAVKNDRARIQIGKISQFGLLELSRQRLRAGVVAGSTVPCPHCGGQGIVRSVESTSLRVLRNLEEEGQKQRCESLVVRVAADVAIYTLNQKRRELARIEGDYDIAITFDPKEGLKAGDFEIDRIGVRDPATRPKTFVPIEAPPEPEPEVAPEPEEETERDEPVAASSDEPRRDTQQQQQQGEPGGRRKRRRRRRGGRDRGFEGDQPRQPLAQQTNGAAPAFELEVQTGVEPARAQEAAPEGVPQPQGEGAIQGEQQGPPGEGGRRRRRRRRRGRRGGRDRDFFGGEPHPEAGGELHVESSGGEPRVEPAAEPPVESGIIEPAIEVIAPPAPKFFEDRFGTVIDEIDTTPRDVSSIVASSPLPEALPNAASTPVWSLESENAAAAAREGGEKRHRREPRAKKDVRFAEEDKPRAAPPEPEPRPETPSAESQSGKRGWWQRAFRSD
jgi:ribonuclease E